MTFLLPSGVKGSIFFVIRCRNYRLYQSRLRFKLIHSTCLFLSDSFQCPRRMQIRNIGVMHIKYFWTLFWLFGAILIAKLQFAKFQEKIDMILGYCNRELCSGNTNQINRVTFVWFYIRKIEGFVMGSFSIVTIWNWYCSVQVEILTETKKRQLRGINKKLIDRKTSKGVQKGND